MRQEQQEPLPQIHLVRDTDLMEFAYKLHILAGDFLRDCEYNMRTLSRNAGADSVAVMGSRNIWLGDALLAYRATSDLQRAIRAPGPSCSIHAGRMVKGGCTGMS